MNDLLAVAAGSLHTADYVVLGIYMLAMIVVGIRFTDKSSNTDDYLLGGRSISSGVAAISYLMTLLSTISLVAVPGMAYNSGVTLSLQSFMGPVFGLIFFHVFIRFYFMTRTFTPFDYLQRRFSSSIRTLTAGLYWITRVVSLGLVLYATAVVFEAAYGWRKEYTILLAGGIGMLYTVLGGLSAVAWTDLIQFVVLVGGMGILLAKIILNVPDGAAGVITYAWENGRGMPELSDASFYSFSPFVKMSLWGMILYMASDHLFYNSADQMAIQRLLSTSGYRQARRSLITCFAIQLPVLLALWYVGLAVFTFYGTLPVDQRPTAGDHALYQFIGTYLPSPLPGLIFAAMLAAVMSTVSGGFNSLATVATVDFYLPLIRPRATQQEQVRFSRFVTLALGLFSIGMGLLMSRMSDQAGSTMVETSFTWLSLVAGIPPVFVLGVLSRRATAGQALVTLLVGWLATAGMLVYYMLSQKSSYPLSFMFVCVPGPVLALAVGFTLAGFSPMIPGDRLRNLTLWTLIKGAIPVEALTKGDATHPATEPSPTADRDARRTGPGD